MSKLIAVWGSPSAGKTTFATKLASAVYERYVTTVIVVTADCDTPMMNIITGEKGDGLKSIGELLSKPFLSRADVLKAIFTPKYKENFGVMGYTLGDNSSKYPVYTERRAGDFLDILMKLCDVLIVDCTSGLHDNLSRVAIGKAEKIFTVCTPDIKSITFLESKRPEMQSLKGNAVEEVISVNHIKKEAAADIKSIKAYVGNVKFEAPFSKELSNQLSEGRLLEVVKEKPVRLVFTEIVTKEVAKGGASQ